MQFTEPLLKTLADLINMPSQTSDKQQSAAVTQWAADYLADSGLHVQHFESNGYSSVLATSQTTKSPRVLLQAHVDVVPASTECFNLTSDDDKLYGRGVYDMKFAAACFLQLAQELAEQNDGLDYGILLTTDEEVGGEDGVHYVLEQGMKADICILPDGGNDWRLEKSCNGVWMSKITMTGKTAHGSRPWEGDNAVLKLMGLLHSIQKLFEHQAPNKISLTISGIQGGEAINQVPASAEAVLDIRYPDTASYDTHREAIEQLVTESGSRLQDIIVIPAYQTDFSHKLVAEFIKIASEQRGQAIEPCHSLGSSDARYFADKNIPVIVIRPHGGGAHGEDEWIAKAELFEFYEILKTYVTTVARV